jgi:hypothetical protein
VSMVSIRKFRRRPHFESVRLRRTLSKCGSSIILG